MLKLLKYHSKFKFQSETKSKTLNLRKNANEGHGHATFTVPKALGSYVLTAVAMNYKYGIGFSKSPAKLTVFLPLSVNINQPKVIRRGEFFNTSIFVSSFLDQAQTVEVSITYNPNELVILPSPDDISWTGDVCCKEIFKLKF